MGIRIKKIVEFFLGVDEHERMKALLLMLSFFFIIGSYTILKELNDALFVSIVGKEFQPWARILSMLILVPAIFFYSRLVDVMRRHQLFYFYATLYGLGGLVFAYLLGNPTIGLANTDASPYRLFGWIFYVFIEGYSPFMVSLFWAFANSINTPETAKSNYTFIVAGSKIGGMLTAAFAWWLLTRPLNAGVFSLNDVQNHQILLVIGSLFALCVPLVVYILMKKIPQKNLHGYEAVYRVEKQEKYHKTGVISGLTTLLNQPYLLGIFGMVFFWEVTNVVFQYQRLCIGQLCSKTASEFTGFLFEQVFLMHALGFIIVLFGTRAFIELLGERRSLILVPVASGALFLYYLSSQSATAVLIVYALIRSINYAFAIPLRETLYIPTTKEMKFKSKSWIDAFGAKIAKGFGAQYIMFTLWIADSMVMFSNAIFFTCLISLWIIAAHLLGRRFESAVAKNEVIGIETAEQK